MDIIKRGSVPVVVYEFTCGNCRSVLHARKDEVEVYNCPDPRDYYTTYSITCPVCHQKISTYKDPSKTIRENNNNKPNWGVSYDKNAPWYEKPLFLRDYNK